MKTLFRYLRLPAAAAALMAGLAACGGSGSTDVTVGGAITGLTVDGLVLANGNDTVKPAANATSFTFASHVIPGAAYAVVVKTQPADLSCIIANGAGVAGTGDIANVQITCSPKHSVGGTVSGLTSGSLVLANGSDTVTIPANATTFTFPAKVGETLAYGLTVLAQPTGLTCSIQNGAGYMGTTDVNTVQVVCI